MVDRELLRSMTPEQFDGHRVGRAEPCRGFGFAAEAGDGKRDAGYRGRPGRCATWKSQCD